jgi:hypothetical protein
MRWACRCCSVVDSAPTNSTMRTVKSRGPGIPTLMPCARRVSALSHTVAKKPGAPGRTRSSRSNHPRGECRDVSAEPVVPAASIFFAGGPWGRPAPGIPRALCLRGQVHQQGSDARCAARSWLRVRNNKVPVPTWFSRAASAPHARPGSPAQIRAGSGVVAASAGGRWRNSAAQAKPSATITQALAIKVGCLPAWATPNP